jgi:hypothetical protein
MSFAGDRTVRRVVLCTTVVLSACGGATQRAQPPAGPPPLSALIIRVDAVRVPPMRPGGGAWDPPAPQEDTGGCEILGGIAELALPSIGKIAGPAASFLCRGASQASPPQTDVTGPDVAVRLSAGSSSPYSTDVVHDALIASFALQPFVVPLDAIPQDGLRLEVVDDDAHDGAEVIGSVRLMRDEALAAVGRPAIVKEDVTTAARLEVVVSAYVPSAPQSVPMRAVEGTKETGTLALSGEVLRSTATGSYKVGTWNDAAVTPVGYPGGGPKGYNFGYEPLRSAAHACAFFLVGEKRREATLVTPCGSTLTSVAGPLVVGVNDNDPSNNDGALSFAIERRAPTTTEWLGHRVAAGECP